MKTLSQTPISLLVWAAGVVTIVLLAAAPAAAQFTNIQFSPKGVYAAKYADGAPRIYAWNYSGWPKGEVTSKSITVAAPWVSFEKSLWRVLDDGSVWLADGSKLTRYVDDATPPQTVDMGPLLPASIKLERVMMTYGPVASILYVGVQRGDLVYEVRCTLADDIFAAGGPTRVCKVTKTFDSGGANDPYTDAGDQSTPLQFVSIFPTTYADYSVTAKYQWLRSSRGVMTSMDKLELYREFKDGSEIYRAEDRASGAGNDTDIDIIRFANAGYIIDSSSESAPVLSHLNNKNLRIALRGSDALVSVDGRYAFTKKPGTGGSSYLIRDLSKPPGTEREVIMPGGGAILLSPDNRFFIQDSFAKPQPIGYLSDPYFGKSDEVVVDLLMARIIKMLGESRWDDAQPAFAELEGRGGDLPEDFYFYQADTLARAGSNAEAQKKADAFIARYGRKSKHYGRMIEILAQ